MTKMIYEIIGGNICSRLDVPYSCGYSKVISVENAHMAGLKVVNGKVYKINETV